MSNGKVSDKVFDMMTAAADKTDVSLEKPAKLDKSTKSIHTALMAAGMTPAYGNIADITDATLYALEGEFGEAAWSAAAAIPFIGQMVSAKRALKVAKESGEEMVTLYRGVREWAPRKMVKNRKFVGPKVIGGKDIGTPHPTAKSRALFVTDDPKYAASRTKYGDFTIHHEKWLEHMKKEKFYHSDRGFPVWPESKHWNKKDFSKAIKTQERRIESVKDTRRREMPGDHILEFEVPRSYVEKFSKNPETRGGFFLFNEGIPVEFLKKVHK